MTTSQYYIWITPTHTLWASCDVRGDVVFFRRAHVQTPRWLNNCNGPYMATSKKQAKQAYRMAKRLVG